MKVYEHDPDCAIVKEIAAHPDEELGRYKIPKCDCFKRQKARKRLTAYSNRDAREYFDGAVSLGDGNFYRAPLPTHRQ
jgi:hypothetical protein